MCGDLDAIPWRDLQAYCRALPMTPVPGGISMGYRITRDDLATATGSEGLVPCLRPSTAWGSANWSGDTFDTVSVDSSIAPELPDLPGPTMLFLYWQAWERSTRLPVVFYGRPGKTWVAAHETLRVLSETRAETRAEVQRWIPDHAMADLFWGTRATDNWPSTSSVVPRKPAFLSPRQVIGGGRACGKTQQALQEVQYGLARARDLAYPWKDQP